MIRMWEGCPEAEIRDTVKQPGYFGFDVNRTKKHPRSVTQSPPVNSE